MEKILVTGGAGYIGSQVVSKLIKRRYSVIVLDNLSTGKKELVSKNAELIIGDILDNKLLRNIFVNNKIDAIFHFAALKDAAESVEKPEQYYETNVIGTLNLLKEAKNNKVGKIVFSSSAAVYGDVQEFPITENFPTIPNNPYGQTKLIMEKILNDYNKAYGIASVSLRYFNAGGADTVEKLGNLNPHRSDLVSVLVKTAKTNQTFFINGDDYDTADGTCIRDLIHVIDLAEAHLLALSYLEKNKEATIINLGSEKGYTVKEIVEKTIKLTGRNFNIQYGPRRKGDVVISIASSRKAKKILHWKPKENLESILESAWSWENNLT